MLAGTALVAALLLIPHASCHAGGSFAKAFTKLGTGFLNVATCWAEIPLRVYEKYGECSTPFFGVCLAPTLGVLEGNTLTLGRLAAGLADMSTFPAPWPRADYEPIMGPIWKREPIEEGRDGAL